MIKKLIMMCFVVCGVALAAPVSNPGNVLVIIADDMGVGALSMYGMRSDPLTYPFPSTPNIDAMKSHGVMIKYAYGYPTCSPSRASMMTGRYGFRTGMGAATIFYDLPQSEVILPEVLGSAGYQTGMIGKWHLTNIQQNPFTAPTDYGFDFFVGTPWNIGDYCSWNKIIGGVVFKSTTYATTDNVDNALGWINQRTSNWFLVVGFNAPHAPYHHPPVGECVMDTSGTELDRYQSMIENLDFEIGRLLAGVDLAATTVVFVGDNGPNGGVTVPPYPPTRVKGTLYEGGIRIPMIISYGKVIHPNRVYTGLVNLSDVFSTVIELAGIPVPSNLVLDSKSLVPVILDQRFWNEWGYKTYHRQYAYSESFPNGFPDNGSYCIRNMNYKYIHQANGFEEFYNLILDPYEDNNIVNDPSVMLQLDVLRDQVITLRAGL